MFNAGSNKPMSMGEINAWRSMAVLVSKEQIKTNSPATTTGTATSAAAATSTTTTATAVKNTAI